MSDRRGLRPAVPYYDDPHPVFTPLADVEWKKTSFLRDLPSGQTYQYELWLPQPLANWDTWDYWERERFDSMRDNLRRGDVLYDVGAEHGWCSVIYALFVGAGNMVLVEPTPEFWPNIKATWERNICDASPLACYDGLIAPDGDDDRTDFAHWPVCADGPLVDRLKYQHLFLHDERCRLITFDALVERVGAPPGAVTIDVEGAELFVLRSAEETLRRHRPKVWVSIHPDLMLRHYGVEDREVHEFMAELGYAGTHLATDHEQHWFFQPGSVGSR